MPRSKQQIEYAPIPGSQYEVLVSKLGIDDGWGLRGQVLAAEDWPDINFIELEARKLVVRVDAGAPEAAPAAASDVVMAARPHREFVMPDAPSVPTGGA